MHEGTRKRNLRASSCPWWIKTVEKIAVMPENWEMKKNSFFERVVAILEQSRNNVVRAVNNNTITAYWMIGREIVQELQGGEQRAEYGKQFIEDLSRHLTKLYGKGFSKTNLWYFRQFYLTYKERSANILHPPGGESRQKLKSHPPGGELSLDQKIDKEQQGFHSNLSWSHYRALMGVEKPEARRFYEEEAIACNWSKRDLERQIATQFYERLLMSKDKQGMLSEIRSQKEGGLNPLDVLKDPYILEFLDLPEVARLYESDLETAIINNLQAFLLELGKGFSFVARQKRVRFGDKDFYVDLVFYNYLLKCFVLVDLKIGELTHQDIGQMDGYVRMYEEQAKVDGDNPTIGLILCSDKNDAIAKYSVLNESQQLFASKYLPYLPTEEELQRELNRERQLIEERKKE